MPYPTVASLPPAVKKKYSGNAQRAFMHAFNDAVYKEGKDESTAFAIAHSAAKRAGSAHEPVKSKPKTKKAQAFKAKKDARKAAKVKRSPIVDAMTY